MFGNKSALQSLDFVVHRGETFGFLGPAAQARRPRRPQILFLDEPTSALDPGNTHRIHESLKELNRAGTTIFLSTHDMEEAETLCDRIAFLHQGCINAMDTPQLLRRSYADDTITVTTTDGSYQVACDGEGARRVSETMSSGKLVSIHSNEPSLSDFL
ncbi:AAA family ATPase [Paenibacillus thiaminolyticus]|uniref:AAA family ATPase n=1 Tax=Paenibacillus thiaminolyticus TaxID=49283 RepID=UPI0021758B69|nr:AAA family ATPase [Paenibacillus thiaminolyticus]